MKFDKKTGRLEILPDLILYPRMNRNDLLTQGVKFENWGGTSEDGLTYSYKTVLNNKEFSSIEGLIVIVYFGVDKIKFWDIGPSSTLF